MIEILKIVLIILAISTNLILGIIILKRNFKSIVNQSMAFFALIFSIWSIALLLYDYPFIFNSLVWIKVVYFIVTYGIIGCLYYFSFIFPEGKEKPPRWGQITFLLFATILAIVLIFTNLFVEGVDRQPWGYATTLGPLYLIFILFCSIYGFWGLGNLVRKYRHAQGHIKSQLIFMFLGFALFIITVLTLDVVFPLVLHTSKYFSLSTVGSLFFVGFTTYSILRYRLLDIKILTSQAVIYALLIFFTALICNLGALIYWYITNTPIKMGVFLITLIVSVIIVPLLKQLDLLITDFVSKHLFFSIYDYRKTIRSLSANLSTYLEMPKLVDIIINTLIQTMQLHRVAVLVRDFSANHYRIQKTIGFNEENGISMVRDNFLTSYLEQNPKIIVLEEIMRLVEESHNLEEKERLQELYSHMEHIEAALIIPIMNNGRMISLIVLGHKISGDSYTVQDIDLLNTIASQASIALENARLYQEVYFLNQGLQNKIDEATIQLQTKNLDLEKANEGLKSLDKMKDQLIAVASHELRTPAANTQNYLWMTLTKPKPNTVLDPEDKERLQKSLSSIKNLIKLIGDILDVSKLEGGKMDVSLESIGYEGIIDTVVEELRPRAQRKGLSLTISSAPNLPQAVLADSTKLREVLTNLITNAIKYTEHGGIIVGASQKEGQIIFYVKDTGRGVAAENIPKLFTKFYREDTSLSASNPETGGTGLGLYITKQMLALMNGQIWLESIQGQGSTFYFSLPATTQNVSPTMSPAIKAFKGIFTREDYLKTKGISEPSLQSFVIPETQSIKKKILLVEDEEEMRTFYGDFLSEKYDIDTAFNGVDGLSKLRLDKYDLVLLDVMMPVLNGVGFMKGLNQDPELAKIPVILLTNLGEKETLSQCFDLGAKAMIMKSDVLPDQIIPVIEKEFQNSAPLSQPQTPPQSSVNV